MPDETVQDVDEGAVGAEPVEEQGTLPGFPELDEEDAVELFKLTDDLENWTVKIGKVGRALIDLGRKEVGRLVLDHVSTLTDTFTSERNVAYQAKYARPIPEAELPEVKARD